MDPRLGRLHDDPVAAIWLRPSGRNSGQGPLGP
jgi:hypothetical protein